MALCPTGFKGVDEPRRECQRVGLEGDVISSVNFADHENFPVIANFNGKFEVPFGPLKRPTLMRNRGVYFDGDNDFLRMLDVRLNFQMTIHAWTFIFGTEGYLFSLETSVGNNNNIFDQELAVRFGGRANNNLQVCGLWNAEEECADGPQFLDAWKILAFRFEDFDTTGATVMTIFANDAQVLSHTFATSNFFHDTILGLPHVWGSSVLELENLFSHKNLEMFLF